jgi:HlyD family secretion protein
MEEKPEVLRQPIAEPDKAGVATQKPSRAKRQPPFGKKKDAPGGAFKKSKKFTVKKLILLILIAAVLLGGGYGIYKLFFYVEPEQIVTGETKKDSIETTISGTATTQPTTFQTLTVPIAGTVKEVYVSQGDKVAVGDVLYSIDTTSLDVDVASLESTIEDYQTQLKAYQEDISNLTISAPFSGKLTDVTTAYVGDDINTGITVATLIDDSTMKLSLYFSDTYWGKITKGMTADVSIPTYMSTLTGTVTSVDDVDYVTSEGAQCFKVTISLDNPGSLTSGLDATATITNSGMTMSPSDSGKLEYTQSKSITTAVKGTIAKLNMKDSQRVSSGDVLMVISNSDYADQSANLEKKIQSSDLNLQDLEDEVADCTPTATVAGTVIFISIEAGKDVKSGTSAMAIYNTDTMKIVADIGENDNDYITEGMSVAITKSGSSTKSFTGTVTKKSLEASASNGVASFETTITIQSDGELSPGIYVTYTITAAQASNVVLAPIAAIQETTKGTCLFIKSDTKPDNAVDLGENVEIPDGYYAVVVETGLTSNDYVEITSGVSEGVTVFERYIKLNTATNSDETSKTSDNAAMPSFGQMPSGGFGGGGMGGGPNG